MGEGVERKDIHCLCLVCSFSCGFHFECGQGVEREGVHHLCLVCSHLVARLAFPLTESLMCLQGSVLTWNGL